MSAPETAASRDLPQHERASRADFKHITLPYVLLTFIPFYEDESGEIWLEIAWYQDFLRHLEYITNLTLLAPKMRLSSVRSNYRRLPADLIKGVRFVGLPLQDSARKAIANVPRTAAVIWREVAKAAIVHSGIVGWPFPLGWIANPIALMRRRRLVIVVESATWRITTPGSHSLKRRARAWLGEHLGRFFVSRADLAIVTQPSYLESLRRPGSRCVGFVNPASWINEADVLPPAVAEQEWIRKRAGPRTGMPVLFAGRLTVEKGVEVLLAACEILNSRKSPIHIDIIGDGELRPVCETLARRQPSRVTILASIPYGPEFLALIRGYSAIIVPSLSDEQPRIIFDAYSQAVPVIASDTDGIRPYVSEKTGALVKVGSADDLVLTLEALAADPDALHRRGMVARDFATTMTHEQMHATRSQIMHSLFMSSTTR